MDLRGAMWDAAGHQGQVGTEEGPSLRGSPGGTSKDAETKFSVCAYHWDLFDGQEDPKTLQRYWEQ